jgi:hypothetical protein
MTAPGLAGALHCAHVSSILFSAMLCMTVWLSLAGRRTGPPVLQTGRVYPKYCGKNTGQNAPQPAMTASGENSARPLSVLVQILLLSALKVRCSTGPLPCEPAAALPSARVECKEVQHQCDYLHPCNIFIIRAISVRIRGVLLLPAGPCRRRAIGRHMVPHWMAEAVRRPVGRTPFIG